MRWLPILLLCCAMPAIAQQSGIASGHGAIFAKDPPECGVEGTYGTQQYADGFNETGNPTCVSAVGTQTIIIGGGTTREYNTTFHMGIFGGSSNSTNENLVRNMVPGGCRLAAMWAKVENVAPATCCWQVQFCISTAPTYGAASCTTICSFGPGAGCGGGTSCNNTSLLGPAIPPGAEIFVKFIEVTNCNNTQGSAWSAACIY